MIQDLKYGLRMLAKNPGFTGVAVLSLALGIGANTAIFSVVNIVLLHPLPYPNSERIVNITRSGGGDANLPMYSFWEQNNPCFDDLAAYDATAAGLNLTGGNRPERVEGLHASLNFFRLFGARPIAGRTFTPDEDRPGGAAVLLMSYGLWQGRFGGDPSLVGKTVMVGGAPYTAVGIMSPKFQSYPPADVWIPLQADPNNTNQAHTLRVSGRLRDGVTLAEANARMKVIGERYVRAHPEQLGDDDKLNVSLMQQMMTGEVRPALFILLGAVSLVLLLACANVANLLLAKAAARQREIAIRSAVGAARRRIIRQLLTESLMLAMASGILGLVLGSWAIRSLLAFTPGDLPRAEEMASAPALDASVCGFTILLALATSLLFGLLPALQVSRTDLVSVLKEAGGRTGASLRQTRTRGVLVALEVGLATILLCGAVLLIRSFVALHGVDPGFDAHNVLTMRFSLAGPKFAHTQDVDRMARELVERVERLPGVASAALASGLPLESGVDMLFNIPGRPFESGYKFVGDVQWRFVSPHYFDVFRIPLRGGRLFREQEPQPTVIVNEAFARKFWPRANPVGKTLLIGAGLGREFDEGAVEIIGVVGDVRENGLGLDTPPVMYQPYAQTPDGAMRLVNGLIEPGFIIRSRSGVAPMSLSPVVTQQVLSGDIQLAPTKIQTMEQLTLSSTARQNFNLLVLSIFAAIALLLAALGIYGVISYSVEQRTHEIGIRVALGAGRSDAFKLVIAQGLKLSVAGSTIGLAASFGLTRLLAAQLYGVRPADPATFATVAVILIFVSVSACWAPALRATRVDPITALRYE
jgi:putative ABC transport system permease protein